jgi:hypothetical protein
MSHSWAVSVFRYSLRVHGLNRLTEVCLYQPGKKANGITAFAVEANL